MTTETTTTSSTAAREFRPPSLKSVYAVRAKVELLSFVREREAMVFTFAFPILLLVIFGAVFGDQELEGGISFAQYFVAGMIAAGLFGSSFQNLGIAIPIERDSGALKRLAGTPMPRRPAIITCTKSWQTPRLSSKDSSGVVSTPVASRS